jgi:hypothetical protein
VREDIHHDFRLGQTAIVKTDKNVEKLWQLVHIDQKMTIRMIQELEMDENSLHKMLIVNLEMCCIMITHQL